MRFKDYLRLLTCVMLLAVLSILLSRKADAGQFAKLSLASAGAGFLGALTNAAGSVGNVMSDAFSKVVSKASEGLSSAENMLETISNTSFTTPQGGQFRQLEADNRLF